MAGNADLTGEPVDVVAAQRLRAADALAVNVPMSVVNANASAHVTISHLILSDPDNDSRMGED